MKLLTQFFCVLLALTVGEMCGSAVAAEGGDGPLLAQPYAWRNVVMGGGGFVTGIVFHPRAKNLMYARTDVGGAYRWEATGQKWIPLLDWVGVADNNLMGVESIAVDPADTNRLYLAVGMYRQGEAAILRSDDQGRTFQRTMVSFKMGGNETGRFNGERLAVDPNDGDILFFGSRHDGLWRSGDRGVTWQRVESFPTVGAVPLRSPGLGTTNSRARFGRGFGSAAVGIVSVVFDPASGTPGQATPGLFAAVSVLETNLYFSGDAGATWWAVTNQPTGLRPNHLVLSPDGMLYLSYGREAGPTSMSAGAVWKFDRRGPGWTNITPPESADGQPFGYGAIAVDAQHPETVMVTTFAHWHPHDFIFRSTNGGGSWAQLWRRDTEWDHAGAPYTSSRSPHWMGSVVINPQNADQVLFTTGFGIWSCVNATGADLGQPTRWVFLDAGLEETVPLALISPPEGAPLLSGTGDVDGFRHEDVTVSPPEGNFAGPRYSNTEDLAYAGKKPQMMVRTGSSGEGVVRAAYSRDNGVTWRALANEPPTGNGGGAITLGADGRTIVWTPQRGGPAWTTNLGVSWVACDGLANGLRVVADTVNPERFYAYDPRSQRVMVSTNGAVDFAAARGGVEEDEGGFGHDGGGTLVVAPGREDELWLALRSAGLWHSTNGGGSFIKVGRVQAAESFGVGKGSPGSFYPAWFLAGRMGGLEALFRSDDAGESWVRINDDRHQYGYVSHVTGDPRIYGRVYFGTGGRGVIYGDIQGEE